MTEYTVAKVDELEPDDCIIVQVAGREVEIFQTEEGYKAITNWCAHQAGPVCEGNVTGTVKEKQTEFGASLSLRAVGAAP